MFEKRLPLPNDNLEQIPVKNLPKDYTDLVAKTFADHLKTQTKKSDLNLSFHSSGIISTNEIGLSISIFVSNSLKSISFYVSADYDPKASTPKVEKILSNCLDTLGDLVKLALEKNTLDDLLNEYSSSSLEDLPLEWTPTKNNKKQNLFVRMDRLHPELEAAANKILRDHDEEIH